MQEILKALNWRYATKRMNSSKVPSEKLETILESIRLTPSSLGLQPYTVLVIENEDLKNQLKEACFNQPQITESSTLLVFASWNDYSDVSVENFIQQISSERGAPLESLQDYKNMILGYIKTNKANGAFESWIAKQAYIGLGFALYTAALEQVDATPMEGFNPLAVNQILGLEEKGLTATVICTLGYRDTTTDYLANAKKIRRNSDDFFIKL